MPKLGTRKLHYILASELQGLSIKIGRDGLFRFLRSENMLVKRKKNYTKTIDSNHWLRKHPNLLGEQQITKPEQAFLSDITYIKSRERTHYLSLVTDAYSRKIIGYYLSNDMSAENVVKLLKMTASSSKLTSSTIHHLDRGMQYCSSTYQKILEKKWNGLLDDRWV